MIGNKGMLHRIEFIDFRDTLPLALRVPCFPATLPAALQSCTLARESYRIVWQGCIKARTLHVAGGGYLKAF
jgi:hypothetical protein